MDCVRAKSYVGTESSNDVQLSGLGTDVTGRHVVLVEDIVDTGNTQVKLTAAFEKAGVSAPSGWWLTVATDGGWASVIVPLLPWALACVSERRS